jgi:hypothetical protein
VSSCIFFIIVVPYVNLAVFFLINTSTHFVVIMKSRKGLYDFKPLSAKNLWCVGHINCNNLKDFIKQINAK